MLFFFFMVDGELVEGVNRVRASVFSHFASHNGGPLVSNYNLSTRGQSN